MSDLNGMDEEERADEIARLLSEAARHHNAGELTEMIEHLDAARMLGIDQIDALTKGTT